MKKQFNSVFEFQLPEPKVIDPLREMTGIIYRICNTVDKKFYIGLANGTFHQRYKGGKWWIHTTNRYLKADVSRLGKDAFIVDIFEANHSPEDLRDIESYMIESHNSLYPNGYNMVSRSSVIRKTSDETRKKMSLSGKEKMNKFPNPFKGKKHTEETRNLLRLLNTGKRLTEEHKAKIRANAPRGENHPMYGVSLIASEATKQKLREKARLRMRAIVQIDPISQQAIKEFAGPQDAFIATGIKAQNISRACRSSRLKAAGFVWRYKDGSSPPFNYSK